MKPVLLQPPDGHKKWKLPDDWRKMPYAPGEIESLNLAGDATMAAITDHLANMGWATRCGRGPYPDCDCFITDGAIGWHTDCAGGVQGGLGIVAVTLLGTARGQLENPELVTSHGATTIGINQTVIFDANKGHAWIANCRCLLTSIRVRKMRRGNHA